MLLAIFLIACTGNNIFNDKIAGTDGTNLSGKVLLDKDSSPDNIFVWLGILNLGSYTDAKGNFELQLPPPESQPAKGVTGRYPLFYYMANYQIDSSTVELLNGKFLYTKADIDENGRIRKTVTLTRLVSIIASVTPNRFPQDTSAWIRVDLVVTSDYLPVTVKTFKYQKDCTMFTNIFFKRLDDPLKKITFYRRSTLEREEQIEGRTEWYMAIHTDSVRLHAGYYELIPYIKILQENIPQGLLACAGEDPVFTDSTYLNIPCKRQNTFVTITIPE